MSTGEKIYKLRRAKGWSQEELAYKLEVSRQTVYKWEADIAKPGSVNLKQLVILFNTTYDFLLNDDITSEPISPSNKYIDKNSKKTNL
ncbi:MAG: helix-turn-helix domain-containing protein [Gammaproteobacteria bacterium]|nr:helix-turn-helix domain-containing protein [Gammaproteobacteria bacterium]